MNIDVQIITGPTGIKISKKIAAELNCELVVPEFTTFPDGESFFSLKSKVDKEVLIVQSCYYPQDTNLFILLNLISNVKRLGAEKIQVFVPYLCYARADRETKDGDSISIETVLNLFIGVGVQHLITLDVHNEKALKKTSLKVTNIYPSNSIANYLKKYKLNFKDIQVIAPDEGALEKAKSLAEKIETSYSTLKKIRSPDDGAVTISMGSTKIIKKEVILVDDIISTGQTLIEASNLLKIKGVEKIHYMITHSLSDEAIDHLREIGNGLIATSDSTNSILPTFSAVKDLMKVI